MNGAAGNDTGDRVRAILARCSGPIGMKKRPDNRKLSERKNTVFSYIMTIFALAARRGLFGGRDFFDDSANIV